MSATMRQGLATLLVAKTNTARKKGSDLFFNVRKDLGAAATHAEHKQYSDLIAPVDKQLFYAETLLHKGEASYFDSLDVLRNLEILQAVTRDIGALPNRYAQRQQLAKQLKEAEERHSKCDAKCEAKVRPVPEVTRPRPFDDINYVIAALLAGLVGYFVVGHMLWMEAGHPKGAVRLLYLLFWPIGIGLELLLALFGATDWVGNEALTILLGFSPVALIVIVLVFRRAISVGEHRHYEELLTRRTQLRAQLCNELAELSKEISRTRSNLGGVDHDISEYRHRIAQNIGEIKWK